MLTPAQLGCELGRAWDLCLKVHVFSSSRRLKPQIYFCTKMMMMMMKMRMNPVLGEDET